MNLLACLKDDYTLSSIQKTHAMMADYTCKRDPLSMLLLSRLNADIKAV